MALLEINHLTVEFGSQNRPFKAVDRVCLTVDRGEVVGIDVCEFYPTLDVNDLTALTIARLFTMVIGLARGPVSTL